MRELGVINEGIAVALLSTIASHGCDPDQLAAKFGAPGAGKGVWPLAKFTAVLEAAAIEKSDPLFGLTLGKAFGLNGLGPIAPLLRCCRTVGDAFQKFTRYFPAFQTNTDYGFSVSGNLARLSYKITDPSVRLRQQDAIFTMALECAILSELRGIEVRTEFVDFQHLPAAESDVGDYRAFFDCEVRFGRNENAISFPASFLSESKPNADRATGERLEADLVSAIRTEKQHIDLSASIEGWMSAALAEGLIIDLDSAAADFGMSSRSFQRKLAEHNINYLDLRNKVRCRIGERLLGMTTLPVTSIALYLGYSETSAFCRHFKKTTGMTASRVRARTGRSDDRESLLALGSRWR
jgi:AraC-like DNA-binding protein